MTLGYLSGLDVAGIVVFCGTLLFLGGRLHRTITLKLGAVTATVGEVAETIAKVDTAVNNRPGNEPTLSQDVRQIRATVTRVAAQQVSQALVIGELRSNSRKTVDMAERAAALAEKVAADLAADSKAS